MKYFIITILLIFFSKDILSQSKLDGRFFYNIQTSDQFNDSSIVNVHVYCLYFKDSLMYSVNFCSCENDNYYYYNSDWSVKKNIQHCIKDFFSFEEISSDNFKTKLDLNPASNDIIYGYINKTISDTTSSNFFVSGDILFEVNDEKWIWENGKKTTYQSSKNEFHDVIPFKEYNAKYVRKNI